MNKKIVLAIGGLFLFASCLAMEPIQKREEVYGKNPPVITRSFAAKELRIGDTWKVYLKAQDPDGDMDKIECSVSQQGMGSYPGSIIALKEENRKEFSGFIYLSTQGVSHDLNFSEITLTVHVRDKAGHSSEPAVVFPAALNLRAIQEASPKGVFQEKELGPIAIRLLTPNEPR
jgi:hypothetical protein